MSDFQNVSVLLPTLTETFSFKQTVEIILEECDTRDICELIAIVCERTKKESLDAIRESEAAAAKKGVSLRLLYQKLPYAGGALRDGIREARGSHILMMAPDLETNPHDVKRFIAAGKKYPEDMITASRWLKKGAFQGYSRTKYILNLIFQKFFAWFYGVKLTDITFAYRLAPAGLLRSIRWEELKHPFFLETALKPIRLGVKIHEIPSSWAARREGESQNTLLQTFKYLRIAFKVKFEREEDILK